MMIPPKKTACFLCFVLAAITAAEEIEAKGPLVANSAFPLYMPFINVFPESATMLGQGGFRFIVASHYANTCHNDPEILIPGFYALVDVETWILSLDANYGLLPFLDIGVQGSFMLGYAGLFDPVISGFHSLFGLPNGSRDSVQDYGCDFVIRHGSDTWYNNTGAGAGMGNITLRAKMPLISRSGSGFSLAFQGAVKFPFSVSGSYFSSGKIDAAATILSDFSAWRFTFYGNAGYILLGKPDAIPETDFNRHLFKFVTCVEYIASPQWSIYLQANGMTSAYNIDEFLVGHVSANFLFGFKLAIENRAIVQVAVSEEFFSFSTTDIGLIMVFCVESP